VALKATGEAMAALVRELPTDRPPIRLSPTGTAADTDRGAPPQPGNEATAIGVAPTGTE
jgi:hypothetical protein